MARRKGVTTIEAMLLAPFVLFLFLCLIDMLFIVHNRTVLQADLNTIKLAAEQHLAKSPDQWSISALSDWQNGNSDLAQQNKRGIVDMMHLFLDKSALAERIGSELSNEKRQALYSVRQIAIDSRFNWFSEQYYLVYDIDINTPFSSLTGHIFSDYLNVKGTVALESYKHVQKMHDIELLLDRVEELSEIELLLKTVRGVLVNCLVKAQ